MAAPIVCFVLQKVSYIAHSIRVSIGRYARGPFPIANCCKAFAGVKTVRGEYYNLINTEGHCGLKE